MLRLLHLLNYCCNIFAPGRSISHALLAWIHVKIPAAGRVTIILRLQKLKATCKNNKQLNPVWITVQTGRAFADLNILHRQEISALLIFELQPRDLQNYN